MTTCLWFIADDEHHGRRGGRSRFRWSWWCKSIFDIVPNLYVAGFFTSLPLLTDLYIIQTIRCCIDCFSTELKTSKRHTFYWASGSFTFQEEFLRAQNINFVARWCLTMCFHCFMFRTSLRIAMMKVSSALVCLTSKFLHRLTCFTPPVTLFGRCNHHGDSVITVWTSRQRDVRKPWGGSFISMSLFCNILFWSSILWFLFVSFQKCLIWNERLGNSGKRNARGIVKTILRSQWGEKTVQMSR